MSDRLFRALSTIQERYLRDPALAGVRARQRHVDWLLEEQARIAGELWDEQARDRAPDGLHGADAIAAALAAYARAEDLVIERELVGRLPARLVHDLRNAWAYREAEFTEPLDPVRVDTGEMSTIHWYDRAEAAHVDVEPVPNPADYRGVGPIEDVALAPHVHWTDADQKKAMEEAIRIYGLEPGQWIELEWPPNPHLWDPGSVYCSDFEPCGTHAEQDDESVCDDCAQCQASVREIVDQMAEWKWTTTLRVNEIAFDAEGYESTVEVFSDQAHEVATIEQDPRHLMIGPPGEGRFW